MTNERIDADVLHAASALTALLESHRDELEDAEILQALTLALAAAGLKTWTVTMGGAT